MASSTVPANSPEHLASPAAAVLFVTSSAHATPASDGMSAGMISLDVSAFTAEAIANASAVVFDVDLANASIRDAIRTQVRRLRHRPPLLFAVDRGAAFHLQTTQANAMGARAAIRRPLTRASIDEALEELNVKPLAPVSRSVSQGTGRTVAVAERIIGASFAALSSGAPLQVDDAMSAAQQLFRGVGQDGLHAWLDVVRRHHHGTFQHCLLVTGAVAAYAAHAELSEGARTRLTLAGLLHDIGKAEIPNAILDKPGRLTDAEFAIIQRHPVIGADYLARQNLPPGVIAPVRHHHEYLDGSGYPDRIKGSEIDEMTRILTVCDIYGALVEERAYKPAKTPSEALYVLIGMAQAGKLDLRHVRTLAAALTIALPETAEGSQPGP